MIYPTHKESELGCALPPVFRRLLHLVRGIGSAEDADAVGIRLDPG
mgnify:CR=1 FL=1